MENIFCVEELNANDLIQINGGGSGSENGAWIAGRIVGYVILGPAVSTLYYAGTDLGWW